MVRIEIDHSADNLLKHVRNACIIAQVKHRSATDPRISRACKKAAIHLDAALYQFEKIALCESREKLLKEE
jgi:hypothetical protein